MNLSELVRRRRDSLGLSMKDVATNSGGLVKTATVCDVEIGKSKNVTASTILGLAKALKTKPDVILEATRISLEEGAQA